MPNFASILALLFLAGCATTHIPTTPFERPFSAVNVVEQEFVVKKPGLYAVELRYRYTTASERKEAWAFSGGTESGSAFTAEVSIQPQSAGQPPTLSRTIASLKLTSWGENVLSSELASVRLEPGNYMLKVRLLGATPPAGVTLSARVVTPYRGK